MNTHPRRFRIFFGSGLLLCSAVLSFASPVTFQVNMAAQIQRGAFKPQADTVLVAGDAINGWNTSASPLTNSVVDTNIWMETYDVPGDPGTPVQYKFIYSSAETGTVAWEGQVGDNGAQNRTFTLTGSAQTLPVVYFSNVTNTTVVTTPVTFQVDMSVQIAQGNFDPTTGTVFVAGDALNNWSTSASMLTNSPTATNIWFGTFPITEAPGATLAYKFVMNGSTWEGRQNRTFTLATGTQTLPVVFFNDVSGIADIPLTFQVDMTAQCARGTFNPATDTVFMAGSCNNWSTSAFQLTNSPANTNVFVGKMIDSTDGVGATIQYKFVINSSTWETINNRTFTITSTNEQVIPSSYFNDISGLGSITLSSVAGGQTTLSWTAWPNVRLQSATNLVQGAWRDVPNTAGQSNIVISVSGGRSYYRLIGP